jgi:hypothetical protein
MEGIVKRKMEIYSHMNEKIKVFKKHLREEEEASHKVSGNMFF